MANVLGDEKKQQVLALGQLGWTLRRIQHATGVRRETAGAYLKAAGIPVRPGIGALISHGTNPVLVHRPRAWPALEQRFEVIMDATPHDHVEPNADDLQRIRDAVLGSDDDVEPPHHQPAP